RGVIVATLPETPENVARVRELVAKNPMLEISIGTSQPRFTVGEPITVKWAIKNVSGATLSIYTGARATELNMAYGGSSRSSSDATARQRPITTRLANGETWTYERIFPGTVPVGPVGLSYHYDDGNVLQTRGVLPDDLYLEWKRGESETEVVPATQTQKNELFARLKSPLWTEQLEAAQKVLLFENPAEWEKLESFATHPYSKLREVAAQALIRKGGFSPALKTLFYQGTRLDWHPQSKSGDFALAILASNAIEAEAREGGYKGSRGGAPLSRELSVHDPRVGDLLAARLERGEDFGGGTNNGVPLAFIAGLHRDLKNTDVPLPAGLKAKVLAAWKEKRADVEKPFTPAQLEAEIALVRKIRYDNFVKGPFYDEVAAIINDGEKLGFLASADMDKINKRIEALPPEAAPDLLRVLQWRGLSDSPPLSALRFLVKAETPEAFMWLAKIAYGRNNGDARVAAIELMAQLDYKRASPHIEAFFQRPFESSDWALEAPRMGAALVLASRGEKRAVPVLFSAPYKRSLIFLDDRSVSEALRKATGLDYPNVQQWQSWWIREGSKMDWK
ncbi:MAG TPA: hypothetical protein VF719_03215, partial [Abditibacteriaceae bacterium]